MKNKLIHALLFSAMCLLAACNKNDLGEIVIKEDSSLPVFTKVDVRSHGDYQVVLGAGHSIQIETHEDIINRFLYEVVDGELFIRFDTPRGNVNIQKLKITVGMESLDKLTLNEVADIEVLGKVETASLEIRQKDVGNIDIEEVAVENLLINLDDVGDIKIARGVVGNGNLLLNGVGHIKTYGVTYDNCIAKLNDVGNIEVTVNNSLDAEITGVGNIYYRGNPDVRKSERGVGEVIQR